MKIKKNCFGRAIVILIMLLLVILSAQTMVGARTLVKVASDVTKEHSVGKGFEYFKERVEELTNGELEVRLYHAGALAAGNRELIEGTQTGQIEIAVATAASMANFTPEFDLFGLPFLIKDYEHMKKVAELKELRDVLDKASENIGLVLLGMSTGGMRQIYSKVPIETVDDLKGLKIRVMEVDGIIATFKALGAIPVPMAFTELYSALQTGVVDAGESSFVTWINSKLIEVAPYGSRVNYMETGRVYIANKIFFEKLSEEHQEAIKKAMIEAIDIINEDYIVQDYAAEDTSALYPNAKVLHPDTDKFFDAVQVVYEEFKPTLGFEMVEKIRNLGK